MTFTLYSFSGVVQVLETIDADCFVMQDQTVECRDRGYGTLTPRVYAFPVAELSDRLVRYADGRVGNAGSREMVQPLTLFTAAGACQ